MRFNLKALGGLLVAGAGVVLRPEFLNVLPDKYASILSGVGLVIQGITGAVHKPESK